MKRFAQISTALVFSAALSLAAAASAAAQDEPPHITVSGEASVSAKPDMAVLSVGVQKIARTAKDALSANNEAMTAVIDELKNTGIEAKDMQTGNFSIQPRYNHSGNASKALEPVGYQVSNMLTVRIRDLSKLGALLDSVSAKGMNFGGGISFTNSNIGELTSKARIEAVRDAIAKAKQMAEAAGAKIGDTLSISENGSVSRPVPMLRMAVAREASPVPVEAGENSYRASVTMTFALIK